MSMNWYAEITRSYFAARYNLRAELIGLNVALLVLAGVEIWLATGWL
jgi:hypothetical protein